MRSGGAKYWAPLCYPPYPVIESVCTVMWANDNPGADNHTLIWVFGHDNAFTCGLLCAIGVTGSWSFRRLIVCKQANVLVCHDRRTGRIDGGGRYEAVGRDPPVEQACGFSDAFWAPTADI